MKVGRDGVGNSGGEGQGMGCMAGPGMSLQTWA